MTSGILEGSAVAERELNYRRAIVEAFTTAMRADPTVFFAGEDVAAHGGVFGISRGLLEEFGSRRVIDTPISEAGLVGLGVGAAVTGCRPIIDLMFIDFVGIAMDQLVNQAAKMKYMFGGRATLPLTVVAMAGAGTSMAAQHSQSLEAWLCHVPGLKVVMPSGAFEAKGLVLAAIQDDNPVVVILNKLSLGVTAPVPEQPYVLRLGASHTVRRGSDVTVVAMGRMVHEALRAAGALETEGISAEVIDPRTLSPLDTTTIVESVKRTNHALVVHEAVRFGGFGGEVAASIQEEAFDWLDAPVGRVGAPFCPVPFAPSLERLYVPDADTIAAGVRSLLGRRGA
jgi:acetoin:2,6-dichlorophenolindophenol oxidoreductase subunit beta